MKLLLFYIVFLVLLIIFLIILSARQEKFELDLRTLDLGLKNIRFFQTNPINHSLKYGRPNSEYRRIKRKIDYN